MECPNPKEYVTFNGDIAGEGQETLFIDGTGKFTPSSVVADVTNKQCKLPFNTKKEVKIGLNACASYCSAATKCAAFQVGKDNWVE